MRLRPFSIGFRPLRGLRVSQLGLKGVYKMTLEVSVPCGVFVFLNPRSRTTFDINKDIVSVPCGVFVFLNCLYDDDCRRRVRVSVPCGVFVFLNKKDEING